MCECNETFFESVNAMNFLTRVELFQTAGGDVGTHHVPRGSGSTVAPYVLMGLSYGGKAPAAILNRDVCPLTLPAASIQAIPYGHGFDADPTIEINSGDLVKMTLNEGIVTVTILDRSPSQEEASA